MWWIRSLRPEDRPASDALLAEYAPDAAIYNERIADTLNAITAGQGVGLVAEDATGVIGLALAVPHSIDTWFLSGIIVAERVRRRGIGQALLAGLCKDCAQDAGIQMIAAMRPPVAPYILGWLHRNDFHPATIPYYIKPHSRAIVLRWIKRAAESSSDNGSAER